jgi:hypothetical protein
MNWALSKAKLDRLGVHPSEYSIVGTKFDAVIDNSGSIDDLYSSINQLINPQDAR